MPAINYHVVLSISFIILIGAIGSAAYSFSDTQIESPRKQVEHGVLPQDVKCKTGLELALKASDGSPVCLMPSHKQRLIERGWAIMVPNQNIKNPGLNQSQPSNMSKTSSPLLNNARLSFQVYRPQASTYIPILTKYLVAGDSVFFTTADPIAAQQWATGFAPGVNFYITKGVDSIDTLVANAANYPAGYDYILYDYESGTNFEPKFTTDQATSETYFDQAEQAVQSYNQATNGHAKLLITPPYREVQGDNWNWGEVMGHVDTLLVQFQGLQHDPTQLSQAINHVSQGSGSFIAQISVNSAHHYTVQEALDAISKNKNVNGLSSFLVYYAKDVNNLQAFLQAIR